MVPEHPKPAAVPQAKLGEAMPQIPGDSITDRDSAAAYLASILEHLALLSRQHGFHVLGYLLDMAQLEARNLRPHPDKAMRRPSR